MRLASFSGDGWAGSLVRPALEQLSNDDQRNRREVLDSMLFTAARNPGELRDGEWSAAVRRYWNMKGRLIATMILLLLVSCDHRCSDLVLKVNQPMNIRKLSVETEKGEMLWSFRANGQPLSRVRYGELPPGSEQLFPENHARPRQFVPKEKLIVRTYEADWFSNVYGFALDPHTFCGGVYESGPLKSLSALEQSRGSRDQTNSPARIIGQWKADPVLGQVGSGVDVLCFHADHTVDGKTETQAGALSTHGTFSSSGDQPTLKWASGAEAGAVTKIEIARDGQTITLVSGNRRSLFRRTGASC